VCVAHPDVSIFSRTNIDDHNKGFYEQKKRKDMLQSERNELCRKEMNLQQSLAAIKEDLSKADQVRDLFCQLFSKSNDDFKKFCIFFKNVPMCVCTEKKFVDSAQPPFKKLPSGSPLRYVKINTTYTLKLFSSYIRRRKQLSDCEKRDVSFSDAALDGRKTDPERPRLGPESAADLQGTRRGCQAGANAINAIRSAVYPLIHRIRIS
jgi:hypothetical protein